MTSQAEIVGLSLLEAARLLGIHPDTLRRAVRRGELQHTRVLGKIRIQPQDLEQFVACPKRGRVGQ